jgi:hypothetical protein
MTNTILQYFDCTGFANTMGTLSLYLNPIHEYWGYEGLISHFYNRLLV